MKETKDIEFRIAKTGHLVPVIDQVFIHSIFDPIKEAEVFAQSYSTEIENNPAILVLGLGFGYHVFKVLEKAQEAHGDKAQVVVVEANKNLVERFIGYARDKNIKVGFQILSGTAHQLYTNDIFLSFLIRRPQIIVHKASFQKEKEYYGEILRYQADKSISSYWEMLRPGLQDLLGAGSEETKSIKELTTTLNAEGPWGPANFFLNFVESIVATQEGKK